MSQSNEATQSPKPQKFWFRLRNPERLEDMVVCMGTVEEIEAQIIEKIDWPASELWISALKAKAKQYELTGSLNP